MVSSQWRPLPVPRGAVGSATGPLRAKDICEALGHEPLPKNIEGTRAMLKRLVKLDVLAEVDAGGFTRKQ
jgi:hypothetical protein